MTETDLLTVVAGIGGLVVFLGLLRQKQDFGANIDVQIYEAGSRFSEIGAGLSFGPTVIKCLDILNLRKQFAVAAGYPGDRPNLWYDFYVGEDNHEKAGSYFGSLLGPNTIQSIHRADFVDELVKLIPPGTAHFHHRCQGYTIHPSHVSASFTDTTGNVRTVDADIVVGADGIRSAVRSTLVENQRIGGEIKYQNWVVWRALIPVEDFEKVMPGYDHKGTHCGNGRHILHFPIRGGEIINFVGYVHDAQSERCKGRRTPWNEMPCRSELLADYEGFCPAYIELLKIVPNPSRWGVYALQELETCVDERVVLMGDAAHATTPHCGAGAGQAVEDALFLSSILSHPSIYSAPLAQRQQRITSALKVYEFARLPRGSHVVKLSKEMGQLIEFMGVGSEGDNTEKVMESMDKRMREVWEWNVEEELKIALTQVEQSVGKMSNC
ncbi:hypothetical protein IAT38_002963 [Cryptococcus sp. DSM 104549]